MMTKMVILHHMPDPNDRPALERWFWRNHCPEVLAQTPWLMRYIMYRAVPAPPGGEAFGYYNYRVHENWVRSDDERRGHKGLLSMTPQPAEMDAVAINVPAEPTEDFVGAGLRHGEKTILRWLVCFRYPGNISVEEGENWYLNVHVPEVSKQPGLIRFFSHKAIPSDFFKKTLSDPSGKNTPKPFASPSPLMLERWHRVSEMWYENNNGWVNSIVSNPPQYTKPGWAKHDKFPFFIPGAEFISTFLLERPDEDLLRNSERMIF